MERLKALPFHSTPQAISCSSRFHGNPAFLFAIWPSSMRFASQNSGCMRTSRTVIVHGLFEVDGVQNFQPVAVMQQHFSALGNDAALGIGDNKADGVLLGRTLHQIGLQPKPRLTRAGTTDNQHVFVPCGTGIGGTVVHGQAFRLGENDVILKSRINVSGNVGGGSPPGRTVLLVVPEFLGILALDIHSQPHGSGNADANA